MISTGWLTILIGIILLSLAGLLYLAFDHFKGRKTSEEIHTINENTVLNSKPTVVSNEQVSNLSREEAKNLERAGRYEDAAMKYEELKMWDKAGDCRRMLKTNYVVSANVNISKAGTISIECPHCGASQPIATKSNEVTCKFCGKNYVIPKKVLDLL